MGPREELEKRRRRGLAEIICQAIEVFWEHMKPVGEYDREWFIAFIASWAAAGRIDLNFVNLAVDAYDLVSNPIWVN